ncbi:membrane protein insertase YidC [Roseivivax isoporae]|uniref:Membrane protein insertase YidC n=1 Tax=Roseivivax isoporae LMG 25204 TaxID=1449351 RepID=X7FET9_9RHOB|nr:membrane protein insertase YidC [Roseivivax isoporae]ETX30566.1 insertase [Roseivivax isoporae LMG 25204]
MDNQNKNLIIATALSFLVILVWFLLFPPPEPEITDEGTTVSDTQSADGTAVTPSAAPDAATTDSNETEPQSAGADVPRVEIDTPRLAGSISLLGGRIDDLQLKDYTETIEDDSEIVHLFNPVGGQDAYYALYGWAPGQGVAPEDVPGPNTEWTVADGGTLAPGAPVTLRWESPNGLIFDRTIAVDDNYMFTVTQRIENPTEATAALAPYGILARHGEPVNAKNFFILHEGAIVMSDGELTETSWDNLTELDQNAAEGARAEVFQVAEDGWIGFTDHYWMSTMIPPQGQGFKAVAKYDERRDIYQTEQVLPTMSVAAGQSAEVTTRLFAGAKEWEAIRDYQNQPGWISRMIGVERDPNAPEIDRFVDSIDWGWFFFLTKPIFVGLHELNKLIGNMGWSIIGLTLIIKAILFPLAYKSYVSMAKMKELQPEMEKIKERAGDDRQKLQQEMMELYKKEKVNPASGCLPILLQIPIFFSLYKVIFVTLELRHAPFFGPFQDLSAPDPTSFFNLFGLLPWAAPEPGSIVALIFIGILPLLLGISMWLQQKLNPAPPDPTQAMIFAWMPWVFMFMLGGFASGLVVYWIANNTITFIQQYSIMRSQGYKPDVFGNIKSSFSRGPREAKDAGTKSGRK